jgi:hypothetical protein
MNTSSLDSIKRRFPEDKVGRDESFHNLFVEELKNRTMASVFSYGIVQ